MSFIVQSKGAKFFCDTVVAPTGYYRSKDGSIVRDGTASPEMGPIEHAYHFASHRSAARVASKLAFPIIREMPYATAHGRVVASTVQQLEVKDEHQD